MIKLESKKGFTVGTIVAVVIGLILLIALAVPVTQEVVSSANLTGTSATVAALLPLLLIIGAVILISRMYQTG